MGKAGEVTPAGDDGWSPWQPVPRLEAIRADVLAETLDGGQAFRWHRVPIAAPSSPDAAASAVWQGLWENNVVRLRTRPDQRLEWSAPAALAGSTAPALARYLALDRDFPALADTLPWRSDPHLARCLAEFGGLRILRQPFGETLLGFLCSATKQIVQIKQMLALLAERHGAVLARVSDKGSHLSKAPHRLPTWPELAQIPESTLRACLLGFRARYIAETARFLAAHPSWLEETEQLPYAVAKERLRSLPGVGEKVADCVLLFGAGRLEAFPVDVWILKTLALRYGLEGWRMPQLAQFGRVHFGPFAGLAQQYLFAWERAQKKTKAAER